MIYSDFQDLKLSRLGFGCMRFALQEDGEVDQIARDPRYIGLCRIRADRVGIRPVGAKVEHVSERDESEPHEDEDPRDGDEKSDELDDAGRDRR